MRNNKHLVWALAIVTALLVVAAVIWPLSEQRNAAIDDAIENDFSEIAALVDDYFEDESRLPDELADVKLNKDQKNRADDYSYELDKKTSNEYELCAEFKTDTSDQESSVNPYDFISSPSFGQNPAEKHSAGLDCIEYQLFGSFDGGFNDGFDDSFFNGFEGFEESADTESQVFEL